MLELKVLNSLRGRPRPFCARPGGVKGESCWSDLLVNAAVPIDSETVSEPRSRRSRTLSKQGFIDERERRERDLVQDDKLKQDPS